MKLPVFSRTVFFKIVLFLSLMVFIGLINSAYTNSSSTAGEVKKIHLQNIQKFQNQVTQLNSSIAFLHGKSYNQKEIVRQFLDCRNAYKEIEYLLVYLDREDAEIFNGGAIPSLDEHSPKIQEIAPEGLQVIEKFVTDDSLFYHKAELEKLSSKLLRNTQSLNTTTNYLPITDKSIFEAVRYSIISLSTLGITGFDSPILKNSLPEALISIKTTHRTVSLYYPQLKSTETNELEKTFNEAEKYLEKNNNFNTFDRLYFIKNYALPLYKQVGEAQKLLHIEYSNKQENSAVNYDINNFFDKKFLDPYFYYPLNEHEKNDKKLVALGRTLFFDPILSSNNKRSCASCHNPTKAFTDGKTKSMAMDFKSTLDRNSPTLINAVYSTRFFYDMRAADIEHQIEGVMFNAKEFNTNFSDMAIKLKQSEEYTKLFEEVFPELKDSSITGSSIEAAIASYVRSLTAFNSPFDKYIRDETTALDTSAIKGFNLFMGKASCGTCHFAPLFNGTVPPFYDDSETEVLGVPSTTDTLHPKLDDDMGRYGISQYQSPVYKNSFKTIILRNIALTAPYMHNGVYTRLEEVVDFYNRGGGKGLGLDVPNQTLAGNKLDLTVQEKKDIVSFLTSLTDTSGITSKPAKLPKFKNGKLNKRVVGGEY